MLKQKLTTLFGTAGYVIYLVISLILLGVPFSFLGLPIWAIFIVALFASLPFIGYVVQLVVWIWSFINVLHSPVDIWFILYFIALAIYVFTTLIPLIGTLVAAKRERRY